MCGIVGYVGKDRCVEVLMEGLKHLEYRGYDSAGLAVQNASEIVAVKEAGPLENLASALRMRNGDLLGTRTGVGHTRWATHGRPSKANAHPHLGGEQVAAVVHNGIIENYLELKEELEGRGCTFRSETDTEVIAHLLAERIEAGESLRDALTAALKRLEGSFAVAAISKREPGTIVAARRQSPLVVGLGEEENYLASAVQALLGYTRRFLVVENDEIVVLTAQEVEISTLDEKRVVRELFNVDWDREAVELGSYEHYMLKEIHEQPAAVRATLSERLNREGEVDLSELGPLLDESIGRVTIVACGTAYHAGLAGKYVIERLARIPVEVAVASEYRYAEPLGDERTLLVAISQSGETTDTLAAAEAARGFGGRVLALTNTQGSLITREADAVLLTKAGPEIGVAATKTFLTQLAALYLLAFELARTSGARRKEDLRALSRELRLIPQRIEETLDLLEGRVEDAAEIFEGARCSLFLGRGITFPVALEGALKLKEISYLPSEGYPAGEMKHGPIALIDQSCPVVAILGQGHAREKTLSNIEETVARGARVIAVVHEGDTVAENIARIVLPVTEVPELIGPLVYTVPLQLLAYRVARLRGLNVDKPRNLAKSVTVE
ncbi:MAG: glutamine--fructose-6-phosphate transaminase (isomerizing) [Actinomycetota bacterium]|nr:glutamine--fructose-6-phosphate transaminase (isomerizing) [Actinomycetota bacterium]